MPSKSRVVSGRSSTPLGSRNHGGRQSKVTSNPTSGQPLPSLGPRPINGAAKKVCAGRSSCSSYLFRTLLDPVLLPVHRHDHRQGGISMITNAPLLAALSKVMATVTNGDGPFLSPFCVSVCTPSPHLADQRICEMPGYVIFTWAT